MKQIFQFRVAQAQTTTTLQRHVTHALTVADFVHADQIKGVRQGMNSLAKVDSDAHAMISW